MYFYYTLRFNISIPIRNTSLNKHKTVDLDLEVYEAAVDLVLKVELEPFQIVAKLKLVNISICTKKL